ncbi:MAG: adenosylcobinamide-GDP ribazoletransferase [Thiothrix sp.]|uniref:adenosylcobinamide-GDP ribazoletransferase n=1 Tax=Thiothrix sp. TaxID=1032 RepID=UPI0026115935|nr:adenosylcobinamide-GDP ribazoletransferase [Thiothrix sp.]MDD5393731.1 adenosylcobinamide-GDP ribazoletransferase [Thiothrix sp.]
MVKNLWRSFQAALAMLTRLPAPKVASFSAEERGRGLIWFPIIGGLMGAVLVATAWWVLRDVEPILASVILLTVWLFVSELHHLDALAHCVSGWMFARSEDQEGGASASDNLGVMGVIALIMMMKFSALSVLLEYDALIYILLAPIVARLLAVALIGFTPVASNATLAHEFRIEFPYLALFVWLLMAVPLALVVGLPMFVMFVALMLIRFRMVQRSGGMTWEGIGASIVLLETLGLFAAAVLS